MNTKRILWGSATSSFQIEGGSTADGKGPSIWDTFCRTPGKISDQSNGDFACDHYHRFREDIALMKDLGLETYRFSIAWPRIVPLGSGAINSKGFDFYEQLVDELLAQGIEPYPTLYHWDLPQALQDIGGWTHPDISLRFAEYTSAVVARLADRVKKWTTLNEPHVFTWLGHGIGIHAPGITDKRQFSLSIRNALLAHGRGAQAIRAIDPSLQVGIANCWPVIQPLEPQFEAAAHKLDQITNRIFIDPIIHGTVPEFAREFLASVDVHISPEDLRIMHQPLDFVGINYYMRMLASETGNPAKPFNLAHPRYDGAQITDVGWEVYPDGLETVLKIFREEYGNLPLYITENGAAYNDIPGADGAIHDARRVDYYRRHIEAVLKAQRAGSDICGYFAWSLMDNFEWSHGYAQRFGLVYVDYENNCQRIPKDSALWYKNWIRDSHSMPSPQ